MRMFLMPTVVIALTGCVTTTKADADRQNVQLGQTAYVGSMRVQPVAVLEDSRCPKNVRCVWAGQVRLKMLWIKPSGDQLFELTLGEPKLLTDGTITLTSVVPEKADKTQTKFAEYRFSFEFQPGASGLKPTMLD